MDIVEVRGGGKWKVISHFSNLRNANAQSRKVHASNYYFKVLNIKNRKWKVNKVKSKTYLFDTTKIILKYSKNSAVSKR
jgi:hypothetical protein